MDRDSNVKQDESCDLVVSTREGQGVDMCEIVAREDFSDVTYLLEISHPMMARAAKPGQFVIVIPHEHGERIPLTIADFDRAAGTITLVIQAVGKTTKEMQQDLNVGSTLFGVVGPMATTSSISPCFSIAASMPAVTSPFMPTEPSSLQMINSSQTLSNLSRQKTSDSERNPTTPMT